FHSFRRIERALSRSDDNKPLPMLGAIACFEQPISPLRILLLSMRTADVKCRWLFAKHPVVVVTEEIIFYIGQRVRTCIRKLIDGRCLFPSYRKSGHSYRQEGYG